MLTSTEHLELVFCASTVSAGWRLGWHTTTTTAEAKPATLPVVEVEPVQIQLLLALA